MSEGQWLTKKQTKTFEELLMNLGLENYSIQFSPGVEKGENFGGIIIKAEVTENSKVRESVSNFIIKCSPPSKVLHSMIPLQDEFEIETYMYSTVFPEFTKIQNEKNFPKVFKPFPDFFKSLNEEYEEMIIMQNVKLLGYEHKNCKVPLKYNQVLLTVKQYAKIHALSYAIRDQKPKLFEEFERNTRNHFFKDFNVGGIKMVATHRILNALKALDPITDCLFYDKFSYFAENMITILTNLISSHNRYQVVSHIDCGIQNLLFKTEQSPNSFHDVFVLDWQFTRMASPAVDLVTFILSAGDAETLSNFNELVLEYYKSLCSFLNELGTDPEKLLPFTVLQEELKTFGIVGLEMAILLIYVYSTVDQTPPDVLNDDAHSDGFAFVYDLKDSTKFDARVRDAISTFYNLGFNFR
ncbi:hypothetical protein RI129_005043 [Pyrocoelia pectoralis]|uniref:CHK kinase-like domain-containing protein n=1 Tax=Pyrocoelia pectoralis TaxID=417401 RepID=A0AAN7VMM8_9COLE